MKKSEPIKKKSKNNPEQLKPDETETNEVASIEFVLLDEGDIKIRYTWENDSEDLSQSFGEMLYYVLSGNLQESAIEILGDIALHGNEQQVRFINQVFTVCGNLFVTNNNKSSPVIRPTQAFNREQ